VYSCLRRRRRRRRRRLEQDFIRHEECSGSVSMFLSTSSENFNFLVFSRGVQKTS